MPIFEYQCKKCNVVFEKLVLSGDAEKSFPCPECSSSETEKLLSRFSGIVSGKASSCPAKPVCEPAGHTCGSCCPMHRH